MEDNIIKRLGFGCVGLSVKPSVKQALRLLDCAYEQGIRFFDTAPLYGSGYSELVLGKFIRDKRAQLEITSKFGLGAIPNPRIPATLAIPLNHLRRRFLQRPLQKTAAAQFDFQRSDYRCIDLPAVQQYLAGSLQRLNTPYIDNYLIHEGIPSFLTDDALEYLLQQKKHGVIRRLGIGASFKNIENLDEKDLTDWEVLQYEYGLKIPSQELSNRFASKKHIHHSIFKSLPYADFADIPSNQKAGYLLAHHLKEKPDSLVLFSSSKEKNIQSNIRDTLHFYLQLS